MLLYDNSPSNPRQQIFSGQAADPPRCRAVGVGDDVGPTFREVRFPRLPAQVVADIKRRLALVVGDDAKSREILKELMGSHGQNTTPFGGRPNE